MDMQTNFNHTPPATDDFLKLPDHKIASEPRSRLTGEVVGLPRLVAGGLVQRELGAVLVPQVEVAEDRVGAVDLARGARQVEVVGEDVAQRGLDLPISPPFF